MYETILLIITIDQWYQ